MLIKRKRKWSRHSAGRGAAPWAVCQAVKDAGTRRPLGHCGDRSVFSLALCSCYLTWQEHPPGGADKHRSPWRRGEKRSWRQIIEIGSRAWSCHRLTGCGRRWWLLFRGASRGFEGASDWLLFPPASPHHRIFFSHLLVFKYRRILKRKRLSK